MFTIKLLEFVEKAKTIQQINQAKSLLWKSYEQGLVGDEAAQAAQEKLEDCKASIIARLNQKPLQKALKPIVTSEKLERRRTWMSCGQIPSSMAKHFTPGQQAVMAVIVSMLRSNQTISKSLKEIGDIAGVCRKTVQRTLVIAKFHKYLAVTERRISAFRNLPHRIGALDPGLRKWITSKPVRWTIQSMLKKQILTHIIPAKPYLVPAPNHSFCSSG